MTRTIAFALVGLALVLLLVLLATLSAPRVKSTTPHAYRSVPQALFSRWPAVPVDAGSKTSGRWLDRPQVGSPRPSILPSVRPTGGTIPPYIAEKGVAGVATFYAYHQGQAAAAARLRDNLGPNWRGMVVRVDGPLGHLYVRLTDYESSLIPGRLIDLDARDFAAICGPLSTGVCDVTVSR